MNPKLIGVYFPQFHNIPENDIWWGKGFTDWELVKTAKPLYKEHYQPRLPVDDNYYNPCDKETLKQQIELARNYNVFGFMFYHYWFDGKLILEKPLEVFLQNRDLDFPFCLSWANASWTRQWIGNNEILLEQKSIPSKELWEKHFMYLLPFFKDDRAIKINNKPIFAIFCPDFVKKNKEMFECWNELAVKNGLNGIYYIATKNYEFQNTEFLKNYDAVLKYHPREANTSSSNPHRQKIMSIKWMRGLPEKMQNKLNGIRLLLKGKTIISSKNTWEQILNTAYRKDFGNLEVFESAFFDWDNTPRYKKKATIYTQLSFEEKEAYLKILYEKAKLANSPFVFFNAWNEWSEGAFLEPDKKNGYKHLEIIKSIFSR